MDQPLAPMVFCLFFAMVGLLVTLMAFSLLSRWLRLVLMFLGKYPAGRPGALPEPPNRWLLPLLVVNPGPWLFLALLFVVYRLLSVPHSRYWEWALGGAALAPLLMAYVFLRLSQRRKALKK